MARLSDAELDARFRDLSGWTKAGSAIEKTFGHKDFKGAIRFLNAVAETAESLRHRPDIEIHYSKITLRLWTPSEGGVTEKDIEAAKKFDAIVAGGSAAR
ncbi:MAG: 4a-hydroxytetrahydrobiopterin dehydratase [Gemmatimonadetes bacterium]|nr:4a-hydroxytetrahydrobiopterin dehydratase [Gemmatimonadota bacterium]